MKGLIYTNEAIQGSIIVLLLLNAINTRSLSLFQLILTLVAISFRYYVGFMKTRR